MVAGLLSIPEAILLGIVEGLTEFLPVSSTGHLLVVADLLGLGGADLEAATDTFAIAIQFGAILAIVALYRARVWSAARGIVGRDPVGRAYAVRLVTAFAPAAVVGLVVGDALKNALFGPVPVAIAWAVGGVFLLAWTPRRDGVPVEQLPLPVAVWIGLAQCVALWPGVSRSLVVLAAAVAFGASLAAAVEFSFLLGLVTLSAAAVLDTLRHGGEMVDSFGVAAPVVGLVAAFLAALVSVRWMVAWLSSRSLRIFGWWRLVAAAVAVVLLATGTL